MALLSISSNIGVLIDIIIIAVLVVFALIGLRVGFFKSVLSMISTVVIIIVSFIAANPLARLINKIYNFIGVIAKGLRKSIVGMGEFYTEVIPDGTTGVELANRIPTDTNGMLRSIMKYVLKPMTASEIQGQTVADVISGAFASIIFTIIVGIILFILIKIIVSLASKIFENMTQIKAVGAVNKVLGLLFGLLKGGLIIVTVSFVLTFLTVIPKVNKKVSPLIRDHTKVAKVVYSQTDDMVEKYVIDTNVIQKWINNLWENKKEST